MEVLYVVNERDVGLDIRAAGGDAVVGMFAARKRFREPPANGRRGAFGGVRDESIDVPGFERFVGGPHAIVNIGRSECLIFLVDIYW